MTLAPLSAPEDLDARHGRHRLGWPVRMSASSRYREIFPGNRGDSTRGIAAEAAQCSRSCASRGAWTCDRLRVTWGSPFPHTTRRQMGDASGTACSSSRKQDEAPRRAVTLSVGGPCPWEQHGRECCRQPSLGADEERLNDQELWKHTCCESNETAISRQGKSLSWRASGDRRRVARLPCAREQRSGGGCAGPASQECCGHGS